jgi:ribosomal-protein-serine acetyltransferase
MKELRIDDDLTLAELRESDVEELAAVVSANQPHLFAWVPWAVEDYGARHAREFIERNLANEDPEAQAFGIFYKGKLAGCIGFVPRDEKGVAEIGYWVSRDTQGRGIITRSTRALADHAFRDLNVTRVEIRAAASNLRSRAVPERLHFDLDAQLKAAHPLPTGVVDDLVVYTMHKRNWTL